MSIIPLMVCILQDYNKLADFKFDNIHTTSLRKQMTEFSASRQASYESDGASDGKSAWSGAL